MSQKNDDSPKSMNIIRDCPVDNFDIDAFGYKKIAKEVAASICQLHSDSGYVIAINGKWGSGKSSFLFYTEEYLTKKCNELEIEREAKDTVVFRFDPWLFSGHQDIVSQFFTQLQAQCDIQQQNISPETLKALHKLFSYGSCLRTVPTLEGQIAGWGFTGFNTIIESKLQKSVKSIFQLKEDIKKELQELGDKIVIIIDDIDRLTSKEIQELFRALKAVADFQNIIYLLAYDEEIVIDALEYEFHPAPHTTPDNNKRAGIKYLEKIVQFEIPLPVIGEYHLKQYTENMIFSEIFDDTNEDLLDRERWMDIYHHGLKQFLKTPRSVIRLHNSLELLYPPLENEVNVIDFICLEVIRQNYPKLYNLIKDNHRYFINGNSSIGQLTTTLQTEESRKAFHQNWLGGINEDKESVKCIMENLFPLVEQIFGDLHSVVTPSPGKLYIHMNYDVFIKYFRFQTEPDLFSNTELTEFLNSLKDPDEFVMIISQLKGEKGRWGSRAVVFLDAIIPFIDENTPEELLENIIIGCFRIKNKLITKPEVVNQSVISRKYISNYISKVFNQALTFYPKAKRLELLREAFSTGDSFWLMADGINIIHQQNGEWGETTIRSYRFLDLDELKEIDKIFVEKLQHVFSTDVCAFASPSISNIIYVWNKLSPDDRYLVDAIENIWENDDSLIAIIHESYEMDYIKPIIPYSFDPFKSEDEFREKVSDILERNRSSLNEQHIASLNEFLSTKPPLKVE